MLSTPKLFDQRGSHMWWSFFLTNITMWLLPNAFNLRINITHSKMGLPLFVSTMPIIDKKSMMACDFEVNHGYVTTSYIHWQCSINTIVWEYAINQSISCHNAKFLSNFTMPPKNCIANFATCKIWK